MGMLVKPFDLEYKDKTDILSWISAIVDRKTKLVNNPVVSKSIPILKPHNFDARSKNPCDENLDCHPHLFIVFHKL